MACEFLAHVNLNLPYFWNAANAGTCPELELLKAQKFEELLELVKEGKVSCGEPLHASGSLLELAMPIFWHNAKGDPVADVEIMLKAMKQRKEALTESHLYTACQAGPAFVKLLLDNGAPLGPAALHLAVRRPKQFTAETVQLLVDAKASVNALDPAGRSPLALACEGIAVPIALLRRLLQLGADASGAKGEAPLHGYARWGSKEGLELLVEHAADVNQQDQLGRTALHCALMGHLKLDFAMALKSKGADVFLEDQEGLTAAELLRRKDKPKEAAALEGREMNAEELRLLRAMGHPVGQRFREIYRSVRWTLNRAVEGSENGSDGSEDEEDEEEAVKGSLKISELLGLRPRAVVLQLPLTRYSELWGDLHLKAPEEGFTVNDLLKEVYQFYQSPFTEAELLRIRQHFSKGILGDTFGYIEENVGGEEGRKKQKVPRLELRGDSIFFEGFHSCKYFEDDETLWGSMSLGS